MKRMMFIVLCLCLAGVVQAASLSYSATAPGAGEVSYLGESTDDPTNVAAGNDAASYFAHDRLGFGVGQTFTTGDTGFDMTGIWLKNVLYTTNTDNGTWWYINNDPASLGGAQLRYRVSEVSGTTLNILSTSNYTVTGTETGNELMPVNWDQNKLGTGTWVYFGLDASIALAANTTYAFDVAVTASSPMYFMEVAGVNGADAYTGGSAYQGDASSNILQQWDGDHTFVVVPEPATMILLGLGGLLLKRRR